MASSSELSPKHQQAPQKENATDHNQGATKTTLHESLKDKSCFLTRHQYLPWHRKLNGSIPPVTTITTSSGSVCCKSEPFSSGKTIRVLSNDEEVIRLLRLDEQLLRIVDAPQRAPAPLQRSDDVCGTGAVEKTADWSHRRVKAPSGRAQLWEAQDAITLENKVVKVICKAKLPVSSGGETLWRRLCEKLLAITTRHKGLMRITEVLETPTNFYLVTERLDGGELFDFLLHERAVPEELCKHIIRQILHAVNFLHNHALLHRDIKPENLMFRRSREPQIKENVIAESGYSSSFKKVSRHRPRMSCLDYSRQLPAEQLGRHFELALIDFDTCKMTDIPASEYQDVRGGRRRLVGTYGYLAPEVLRGHEYTRESDLWSVGVIFYILMTGIPPVPMDLMVNARCSLDVLQKAQKDGIDFDVASFPEFPAAQNLCQQLLEFDPARRVSSAQHALRHPWLYPLASNAIPFYPLYDELSVGSNKGEKKTLEAEGSGSDCLREAPIVIPLGYLSINKGTEDHPSGESGVSTLNGSATSVNHRQSSVCVEESPAPLGKTYASVSPERVKGPNHSRHYNGNSEKEMYGSCRSSSPAGIRAKESSLFIKPNNENQQNWQYES